MPIKLLHPVHPVTYCPRLTVERAMVRAGLAKTEGSAHQKLLRARGENLRIAECFLAAHAIDRLLWFTEPLDGLTDGGAALKLRALDA